MDYTEKRLDGEVKYRGVIVNVKKDGYYGTSVREFIRRQTEDVA